jgi:hypothetical protein
MPISFNWLQCYSFCKMLLTIYCDMTRVVTVPHANNRYFCLLINASVCFIFRTSSHIPTIHSVNFLAMS